MKSALVIAQIALFALAAPALAKEWHFDATVDGKPLGTHDYTLTEEGGQNTLHSVARYRYKIMAIEVYRYDHEATESWRGGCLEKLSARTDEKGNVSTMTGSASADGFAVDGPNGKVTLPKCVMTFAYWTKRMLEQSHLLNPQTQEWTPIKVSRLGRASIDARGARIPADHYKMVAGKDTIELWYGDDGEWLALRSTTPEGRVVDYRLR
jgi:uncharacterized protein DUF6134